MRNNARVLQGGPSQFKGQPLLRIHVLGFVIGNSEKRRIKTKRILKICTVLQAAGMIRLNE
ncbi:hypothetical protein B8W66_23145 [Mycobacterium decipiens]|uniref:Uncharacterized protein n=1 Tax=Mycobacterium decipiens TaxID=1430326 RepID=A0A1X2LNN7_9MYCO|nr:hypothetical protein B8W66_23145 [Mycobacterium decipiens]